MVKQSEELDNPLLIKPEAPRVVRLMHSNQQVTPSQDGKRRADLSALDEKSRPEEEKKKAKKLYLSLVKYHAQELCDLLIQKPNHPLCVAICTKLKILLNLKSIKNTQARPPKEKT